MSLYLNLREIREKKGISQEELAEKLGVSRIMIIHYEKGRNYPSLERAVQISSVYRAKGNKSDRIQNI